MLTQRLGFNLQKNSEYIDEFIKTVKMNPGSCDEVWLSSNYGFPPLETHKKSAEVLLKTTEKLRAAGIRVSLQISNTIGHGQYMSALDCSGLVYDGSDVEKIVGDDGTVADYAFCWNSENFRKYTLEAIKPYLAVNPYAVWIDDDFRASNHAPVSHGCFCDNCIKKFNEKYGYSFSRDELVSQITIGKLHVRENYVAFMRETLGEFMFLISKTVHELCPETKMGLQHYSGGTYTGSGLAFLFDAMLAGTGFTPLSRPGGGVYNDLNPTDILRKARSISWQMSLLPEYIEEVRPEIENLPDTPFSKSPVGTAFESSVYFAYGSTAMSYAMLMKDYEPLSFHNKTLGGFTRCKPYWEKLVNINKSTVPGGLVAVSSKNEWLCEIKPDDKPFAWCTENYEVYDVLTSTAIPTTFGETANPVFLLHPKYAQVMSLDEAEYLMDKPVVTDGETLRILEERGFRFSASASPVDTSMLYEIYSNHTVNSGFVGKSWDESFYILKGSTISGECEILGLYDTSSKNCPANSAGEYPYGIADAIVKTEKGSKWAVFGHSPWNNNISTNRRNQILNAADYISGNRLPAILMSPQKAVLLPRESKDGLTACVSIINCTVGKTESLLLKIRRPLHGRLMFMAPGMDEPTKLDCRCVDDDLLVTTPAIDAWSIGTVFTCE